MSEMLHFKVSAGLKNIIGKELINDKFIAIFELVKNSYDAGAKNVTIKFVDIYTKAPRIIIADDGKGMSKDDIINKWLFVAYSEKKHHTYRDDLRKRRPYAGAKGVGRFSCDRLGEKVQLFSKTMKDDLTNAIAINWNDFEVTDAEEFQNIKVKYEEVKKSVINEQGTIIVVDKLREKWNREELLKLKKALTQLVNPDATENYDKFEITIDAVEEKENDIRIKKKKSEEEIYDKDIVNGKIVNHVFEALNVKTTKIEVSVSEDGKQIVTTLNDRGIELFKITEKNRYSLKDIKGTLYSLNKAAKNNFTRIMGIESINYGSVFIYKNGFRVYPYGEPDKDFMNIDRRKTQGYNRYLGTREIIGRVDIFGENKGFIETSSRNNGFISSYQVTELEQFFYEYMLKPLEKYVVNIIKWGEDLVNSQGMIENISKYDSLEAILKKIRPRFKVETLIEADYNEELVEVISKHKQKKASAEINELKKIARKQKDEQLVVQAEKVEKKTKELEKSAAESFKLAQQEIEKREEVQRALDITQKQVGVLQSRVDISADGAIDAMHIMKAYADTIDSGIEEIFENMREDIDLEEIKVVLHEIRQTCSKIMNAYNLVINTNYDADTGKKELDIVKFTKEYIDKQWRHKFNVAVQSDGEMKLLFNPLEFSIVIDNIVDNSKKANATELEIIFNESDIGQMILFRDDGFGMSDDIRADKVFEEGSTTTRGTGIGLYTVKKYVDKMDGVIRVNEEYKKGFELRVRFDDGH